MNYKVTCKTVIGSMVTVDAVFNFETPKGVADFLKEELEYRNETTVLEISIEGEDAGE